MSDVVAVDQFVLQQESFFSGALCDPNIAWGQESQFALQALQNNDYLCKIAGNNLQSLQNAIINVAAVGISLNPALKHAYLIPRKGTVCLDVSYMGLMHLAQINGAIQWGQAKVVFSDDEYTSNGIDKEPTHKYKAFGKRGDPVGCFCTVKLPNGDYLTEEMDRDDILAIRDRSEAFKSGKSCPWKTDELEMWRKTVVKRASKYWPDVERLNQAVSVINEHEGIDFESEGQDPLQDKFHEYVQNGEALEMVLLIKSIDEARYTNLYNSGKKGEKVKFKEAISELERIGHAAVNEVLLFIDEGQDYEFKETVGDMSKEGKTQLFKEMTQNQQEIVKSWAENKGEQ